MQILTLLKAVFILDRDTIVDGVLKKYTVYPDCLVNDWFKGTGKITH